MCKTEIGAQSPGMLAVVPYLLLDDRLSSDLRRDVGSELGCIETRRKGAIYRYGSEK